MQHPPAKKIPVTDTYFDTQVVDNYRWIENSTDPDVSKFVIEQNLLTDSVMNNLPEYDYFLEQITASVNYEKVFSPVQVGDYIYFWHYQIIEETRNWSYVWDCCY